MTLTQLIDPKKPHFKRVYVFKTYLWQLSWGNLVSFGVTPMEAWNNMARTTAHESVCY